jgi:hypothetical protein
MEKIISILENILEQLKKGKDSSRALGIDSSPIDDSIKNREKELENIKADWQAEKRKINAIVKVAKMYRISLPPFGEAKDGFN